MAATPDPPAPPAPKFDLSRLRHELRTPINHILGYCELLQEEGTVPAEFQLDLKRIHGGGMQLLALIKEYFDEATFEAKRHDLQRLCHELRTPVNHIVGYAELLEEQCEERGLTQWLPDLRKIAVAGHTWLGLMEEYLVPPSAHSTFAAKEARGTSPLVLPAGLELTSPLLPVPVLRPAEGHLLLADDDATNREMLVRRLERQGYRVSQAGSGPEVLSLVRAHSYDLVLLDMIMPGLDGYQVLTQIKSDPALADLPVIILSSLDQENSVARCIEAGAEDYVSKPFNSVFLRARIGASLERKRLRDQERQMFEALKKSQRILCDELAEAAAYVRSLLPPPWMDGPIRTDWRFVPSTQLGGDAFGYHWLEEGRFAFYVLDVCGHGVGAALLSVSVMNVLRNRAVPQVDFGDPAAVLAALNRTFPMERQNNMFFTIWYGVMTTQTRELAFACGGHPPAVLLDPTGTSAELLRAPGAVIGGFPEAEFRCVKRTLVPGSRLYVFSDGVYELARRDGSTAQLEDLVAEFARLGPGPALDHLVAWAAGVREGGKFEDDVSLVELRIL